MKKWFSLILAVLLMVSLLGCGAPEAPAAEPEKAPAAEQEETPTAEQEETPAEVTVTAITDMDSPFDISSSCPTIFISFLFPDTTTPPK